MSHSPSSRHPAQSSDVPFPVQPPSGPATSGSATSGPATPGQATSNPAAPDEDARNLFCPAFSADDAIAEAQAQSQAQPQTQAQTGTGAGVGLDPESGGGSATGSATDSEAETGEAQADTPASLSLEFALCDSTCHSTQTTGRLTDSINTGLIDNPNLMTWTHLYPLEEAEANSELRQYVILLQLIGDSLDGQPFEPDLQGLAAWSAGRLFEQAVRLAVENQRVGRSGLRASDFGAPDSANAPPPLTQQAVAEAVESITDWTSNGLHAPTNPARREPTSCFALLAWNPQQASWQRQHPVAPGQWDCQPDNLYTLQITANLGLGN